MAKANNQSPNKAEKSFRQKWEGGFKNQGERERKEMQLCFGTDCTAEEILKDLDNKVDMVVVDYGDFIVHVFDEDNREKYSLETVWEKSKEIIRIH